MTKKEAVTLNEIAKSIETLALSISSIIDSNVSLSNELKSLMHRVNELELSTESIKEPLVVPVVRRKRAFKAKPKYRKKNNSPIFQALLKIRKALNAHT